MHTELCPKVIIQNAIMDDTFNVQVTFTGENGN